MTEIKIVMDYYTFWILFWILVAFVTCFIVFRNTRD